MSLLAAQTLYALTIGSTTFDSVSKISLMVNPTIKQEFTDGQVYSRAVNLVSHAPKAEFTVMNPVPALNLLGMDGTSLESAGIGNLVLYAQGLQRGGTRLTTGSSATATRGVIYPTKLSCAHQGDAELMCEVLGTSVDGAAAVFAFNSAATMPVLPAPTGPSNQQPRYTIGTVEIAGITLAGVTNIDVDFGIKAEAQATDSDIEPSFGYIKQSEPKITIRGKGVDWLASIGYFGSCVTHANTSITFRQRDPCGNFTSHRFGLSVAGRADINSAFAGNSGDPLESEIIITGVYDGTNSPFEYSVV